MSPAKDARTVGSVHLVRHAHAGDALRWEGPDARRPLTEKGRAQAANLGALLVATGVGPDRIVTSPKARALQTAQIVGDALGIRPVVDDRLAEDCGLATLDRILGDIGGSGPMVVGHDPYLSELLAELLGGGYHGMRKGAIATVAVTRPLRAGTGRLRWLIPPEVVPPRPRD